MINIDFMQKRTDTHLTGIKEATSRSRNVLLFLNLATLVIFISLFNETYSWQRHINVNERPLDSYINTVGLDKNDVSFKELRKHYADIYFERQFFNVPLLGIRCTESDLTIFAPIALLIFTTWLFFSLRRENHIVKNISTDFEKIKKKILALSAAPIDERDIVGGNQDEWKILLHTLYSGCKQNFVLSTPTVKDYNDKNNVERSNRVARPIMSILNWTPLLILACLLLDDVKEYFSKDFMRNEGLEILILDAFLTIISLLIAYQINVNRKISNNTKSVLLSMSNDLGKNLYMYEI
jgi:hypothetical protein